MCKGLIWEVLVNEKEGKYLSRQGETPDYDVDKIPIQGGRKWKKKEKEKIHTESSSEKVWTTSVESPLVEISFT